MGVATDPRLILANVVKMSEGDTLGAKTVLSLINIEEDKVAKIRENFTKTDSTVMYKNPPVLINIYILFASNMLTYAESLKVIAYIMQFFQSKSYFTPTEYPGLDSHIERLNVDLFSLNFEQINHIWSTLGGKYLPSVMYKVRQLTIEDEGAEPVEGKLIETITTETSSIN
jgi:hypothetical protein